MGRDGQAPGSAGLQLAGGAALLRPEEQVLAAMLDGWRAQQLARNLAFSTIEKRLAAIAGVHRGTRMRCRGRGARRWWMSGWVTCGRSGGCAGRRSATMRWRCRRSAGI